MALLETWQSIEPDHRRFEIWGGFMESPQSVAYDSGRVPHYRVRVWSLAPDGSARHGKAEGNSASLEAAAHAAIRVHSSWARTG